MADIIQASVQRDIEDIGKSVNTDSIVTPRIGEPFKSIPMVSREALPRITELEVKKADKVYVDNALTSFTNGASKFYPTLAQANLDIANIQPTLAGSLVRDKIDIGEIVNGGAWYKENYDSISLTKSPFDSVKIAKEYTDLEIGNLSEEVSEKTKYVKAISNSEGFYIVDEIGAVVLKINKNGEVITHANYSNLTESQTVKTNDLTAIKNHGEYVFAIADQDGRVAFGVKKDGSILPSFQNLLPSGSSNFYTLPFNTNITELNQALAQYKYVSLSPNSTLVIDEPIRIPNFGILDLAYSDVRLASGADCYMIQNDDLFNGADVIGVLRGRIDGNDVNQVRNLTGDFKTGYYGFGACFSKVKNLIMDDFYVKDTNGWGIAYHLCGTVMFRNFDFDQNEKRRGVNGDGITGSAKRIYYENLRGYTNDDLCAVTTGRSTLQGVDAGILDEDNIDIELVSIKNICGVSKNGIKPHVGVGIYPTCRKKIKNVVIDGVSGEFDLYQYRLQNYWTHKGDGFLGDVTISNMDTSVNSKYGEIIDVTDIDRLTISSENSRTEGLSAPILAVRNSGIKRLILNGVSNKSSGAAATPMVGILTQTPSRRVERVDFKACDAYRGNAAHKNCLLTVNWVSNSPPITISSDNCFVEGGTSSGVLEKTDLISGDNYENINYVGTQLIKSLITLQNSWVGSAFGLLQSSQVKLTGKISAENIAMNTVIFTLPKSLRPADEEIAILQSITSTNFLKIKIKPNGDAEIVDTSATISDVFNLNSVLFYKL